MKRLFYFAILVIGLDRVIGFSLDRLYLRTESGESGGLINHALRQNPDILVLGSSRAKYHVSPDVLADKLSVSAYNAGIGGQDFLYAVMLLDLWGRSGAYPKVILLQIDYGSLSRRDEEIQRTSVFSAYYGKSERVRDIIAMRGKYERIKYLSSAYRFNGKVLPILKNLRVHPDGKFNGFVGLEGSLDPAMAAAENPTAGWGDDSGAVWAPKLEYLREIAGRCRKNGTRLILFHSPYFEEDEATLKAWLTRLAALHLDREGIEYLDLSERTHPLFAGRPDLFKDRSHLNSKGAVLFSTALANELAGRIGPKLTR